MVKIESYLCPVLTANMFQKGPSSFHHFLLIPHDVVKSAVLEIAVASQRKAAPSARSIIADSSRTLHNGISTSCRRRTPTTHRNKYAHQTRGEHRKSTQQNRINHLLPFWAQTQDSCLEGWFASPSKVPTSTQEKKTGNNKASKQLDLFPTTDLHREGPTSRPRYPSLPRAQRTSAQA